MVVGATVKQSSDNGDAQKVLAAEGVGLVHGCRRAGFIAGGSVRDSSSARIAVIEPPSAQRIRFQLRVPSEARFTAAANRS